MEEGGSGRVEDNYVLSAEIEGGRERMYVCMYV